VPHAELSFVTVGLVVNTASLVTCVPVMFLNQLFVASSLRSEQAPLGEALLTVVTQPSALPALLAYQLCNLLWNAALLGLTAKGSALHAFLALKLVVPCVALLSGFDWPLIGAHPTSPSQWLALVGLGAGISGYQYGNSLKHQRQASLPPAECDAPLTLSLSVAEPSPPVVSRNFSPSRVQLGY